MNQGLRLLGAVLAGGRGRRFGGPKSGAVVAGVAMGVRAAAALRGVEQVDHVVFVCSPDDEAPPSGAAVIRDRLPGAGPLGGLEAALVEAARRGLDGALVLACDLPLMDSGVLRAVVAQLGPGCAAAPARRCGGVEPLAAVYRVAALPTVRERLANPDRSLQALFRDLGGFAVPADALGPQAGTAFLNVNTPSDHAAAERALALRPEADASGGHQGRERAPC